VYKHYGVGRYAEMIILHGFFFFRSFVLFFPLFFFCFSPIIAAVPLMISCSTKGMLYYIHVLIIRITTIIIVSDRFRKPKLLSITSAYTYTHIIYPFARVPVRPHARAHTRIILHRISGRIRTTCTRT